MALQGISSESEMKALFINVPEKVSRERRNSPYTFAYILPTMCIPSFSAFVAVPYSAQAVKLNRLIL